MSSAPATIEEVAVLASQTKNFIPVAADRQPSVFLSLAPATSNSYPQPKKTDAAAANVDANKRRSSSLSSNNSDKASPTGLRFLKLGPVHWGEHLDDHKQDWHEVAIE